jgi:hypothetical protein
MQRIYKVTGKTWYSTESTSFFVAAETKDEAAAKADEKTGYENFDIESITEVTWFDVVSDVVYDFDKDKAINQK